MLKGFTLFELLLVMLLVSISLRFSLPVWQQSNEQAILAKEQQKLYLFLRKMQGRVENSNTVWFLIAHRDLARQQWCLTVQPKSDTLCNCLNATGCPPQSGAHVYYPAFEQTMLVSKKYYPQELARFGSIRDTVSSGCFVLQAGQNRSVFTLYNIGSVKVKNYQSASACTYD